MSTNALTVTAPDGLPFIDFTREFDFAVADVFRAHADPTLVVDWMGPRGMSMDVAQWEFRTGGMWSFLHTRDGESFEFRGVFHTVRENDFVMQTFEFGGYPDVASLESLTFIDLGDGRTRLSAHAIYQSMEARDGMIASGMEWGMREGNERLDELLAGSGEESV